jgi:hypothetical protein
MKRTALALTLIFGLVIATLNIYVTRVQAQQDLDSLEDYYNRYKPTMTPPSILVTSPQNYSIINTSSISLVFNVSAPQVIEVSPDVNHYSTWLSRVYCKGDWQDEEQVLYSRYPWKDDSDNEAFDFLEFNTTLSNIPEGKHELKINAVGVVGIKIAMFGCSYNPDANASIIFTVNSVQSTSPEPKLTSESFPITLVVAVSGVLLAVVSASLLVYFKKVKKKPKIVP